MIRYLPSATFSLPRMIKFSDGGKHIYTYDASGRKLRAEHHVPIMVAAEPQVLVEELILSNDNLENPGDTEQMQQEHYFSPYCFIRLYAS